MIAVKFRFSGGVRRRLANRLGWPQSADRSAALFDDIFEAIQKLIANSAAIAGQGLGNNQLHGIDMQAGHFDGTGIDGLFALVDEGAKLTANDGHQRIVKAAALAFDVMKNLKKFPGPPGRRHRFRLSFRRINFPAS